jgi:hypothetical protein
MRVKGIVAIGALVISRGHEMGEKKKSRLRKPEDRRIWFEIG